jgi:hypothetical protein
VKNLKVPPDLPKTSEFRQILTELPASSQLFSDSPHPGSVKFKQKVHKKLQAGKISDGSQTP